MTFLVETWIVGMLRRVERIQVHVEDMSEQGLLWDSEETGLAMSKWRRGKVEHQMAEEQRKPNGE